MPSAPSHRPDSVSPLVRPATDTNSSLTLMYRLAVALDSAIAGMIDDYARGDLPPREWFTDYFDFIRDPSLRERLSDEFYTTRYVYKILEGLAVQRELQVAQVRLRGSRLVASCTG